MRTRTNRHRTLAVGLAAALALLVVAAPAAAKGVQLVQFGGQTFSSPDYVTGDPGDPSRVLVVERAGRFASSRTGSLNRRPS